MTEPIDENWLNLDEAAKRRNCYGIPKGTSSAPKQKKNRPTCLLALQMVGRTEHIIHVYWMPDTNITKLVRKKYGRRAA